MTNGMGSVLLLHGQNTKVTTLIRIPPATPISSARCQCIHLFPFGQPIHGTRLHVDLGFLPRDAFDICFSAIPSSVDAVVGLVYGPTVGPFTSLTDPIM